MRKHKFRIWDDDAQEMIYEGGYAHFVGCNSIFIGVGSQGVIFYDRCDAVKGYEIDTDNRYEVMEYTGLHDKNGDEIWEGDIIKHEIWGIFKIVWDELSAAFRAVSEDGEKDLNLAHAQLQRTKVIGNIYKNPEILQGEQT